jgi:CRP/FNR family transcriptional regulator, cyclic AMP receptor protein
LRRIVLVVSAAEAIISSAGKMVSAVYSAMLKIVTCHSPVICSGADPMRGILDVNAESDGAHDFRPAELSHPGAALGARCRTWNLCLRCACAVPDPHAVVSSQRCCPRRSRWKKMSLQASTPRTKLAAALDALAERGWFAARDARARALIGAEARLRIFAPGEAIYWVGDPPDGLYGLVEGTVRISFPRDDGEDLVLHRFEPGAWLGDLAHFAGGERLVSVSAVTRTCTVHLSADALERLVAKHPDLWRDFYALSHLNFRTTLRVLASTLAPDSERRVALRLLQMQEEAGEPERGIAIPQTELAAIVGVSVPTLQRVLRRLGDAGLIDVSYGRVRVRDRTSLLRRLVDERPAAEAPSSLPNN